MKIIKVENKENEYRIENLTLGKIIAIKNALEYANENKKITAVGSDVLTAITNHLIVKKFTRKA